MRTALLRYARLPNLDLRLSPIALSHSLKTLSNPTLLKRVAGHIRADIQDLLELQKNTGCTIINTDALQSFGFMNAAPSQDQYHLDLGRFMHASTLCDNGHYQEALLLFEQIKTFTNDKLTTNKVLCYLGLNEKEKARDLFKAIEQPTQELRKLFSVSKPLPAHPLPSHTRGRIDYSPERTSPDIVGSSHSYQMQQFGAFSPAATGRPQPSSSSSQEASQKPELKRQDSLSKLTNTIKGVVMIKSNKPHHYSLVFVTEFPRDYHKNSKIIYLMQDSASGNWHYSKYSKKYKKAIMGEIFGDSLPQKRPDHSTPEENLGWIVTILNHMESGMGVTNKI
jgi:hypothetical protein